MPFGRVVDTTTGNGLRISADGNPEWKIGGVVIDWSTVAAVGSDTTIPYELTVVKNGQKFLRYGQVVTKIVNTPTMTLTITATGGTYTISGQNPLTGGYVTTTALAYNAVAATIQAALDVAFGAGNIVVTGTGPWTFTPAKDFLYTALGLFTANGTLATGGTVVIAQGNAGTAPNNGMFGPYDPAASDGRQTLTDGEVFIINSTVLQNGLVPGLATGNNDSPGVLYGGQVYKSRVLATAGTHSLAAGPTYTELKAVLPRLVFVEAD